MRPFGGCSDEIESHDLVRSRTKPDWWHTPGRPKGRVTGRGMLKSQLEVEWDGAPAIFAAVSAPIASLQHDGVCPPKIAVGDRVAFIRAVPGADVETRGVVMGRSPENVVLVRVGDRAVRAYRWQLRRLAEHA